MKWLVISSGQIALTPDGSFWFASPPAAEFFELPLAQDALVPVRLAITQTLTSESTNLRALLSEASAEDFQLLSRATQLEHWWRDHQFCGRCGMSNQRHTTELAMACAACGVLYFPRISPCVIALVRDGDRCLLAKHYRSRSNRYSTLAGFIEAGESAEQALHREVKEEVNVTIANLQYVTSQAWPFPSQLMLGFTADYAGGGIEVDGVEISDAQWFSPENLPEIPPKGTISRVLIDHFLQSTGCK